MQRGAAGVGLGLGVLSAATFGTAGAFASSLIAAGWSPAAAAVVRVSLAALVLTGPALVQLRGRWWLLRRSAGAVLGYGGLAVAVAQLCYFNALDHVTVGVALLLEYSGVLLVVAWVWLRHGQRPRRLTLSGAAVAIAGLVLVLDITGSQRADAVGVLWGLAAAVGLAAYFVISSHTDDRLPPIAMAWSGLVVGALVLAVMGVAGLAPVHARSTDVIYAGHRVSWVVPVLGLSLVAAVVAYAAGIGAARRLGARLASFVGLAEVLFAVLFAWALLGQRPSLEQAIGGVFVLAGIALVHADERTSPELMAPPAAAPAPA